MNWRSTHAAAPVAAVDIFWFAGMSCDGCSVALTGAGNPPLENLLRGGGGLPRVILHHPLFASEAGNAFLEPHRRALRGENGNPYIVVLEGSATDEILAGEGYWAALGTGTAGDGPGRVIDGVRQPLATMDWVRALAPAASAVVAMGTCATWGGVPAAFGSPTGAMSLSDLLGREYRSTLGIPIVNVPGCSPVGDNMMETMAALLLCMTGLHPGLELDDLGRPAWLFAETVHRRCNQVGYYEDGMFAAVHGDGGCLAELGCWGPVVHCNITTRGAIGGLGGCMQTGGACIGCTMPGFPDKFSPFYQSPAGSALSSGAPVALPAFRSLPVLAQGRAAQPAADSTRVTTLDISAWSFVEPSPAPANAAVPFFERWRMRDGAPVPAPTIAGGRRPGSTGG